MKAGLSPRARAPPPRRPWARPDRLADEAEAQAREPGCSSTSTSCSRGRRTKARWPTLPAPATRRAPTAGEIASQP